MFKKFSLLDRIFLLSSIVAVLAVFGVLILIFLIGFHLVDASPSESNTVGAAFFAIALYVIFLAIAVYYRIYGKS